LIHRQLVPQPGFDPDGGDEAARLGDRQQRSLRRDAGALGNHEIDDNAFEASSERFFCRPAAGALQGIERRLRIGDRLFRLRHLVSRHEMLG